MLTTEQINDLHRLYRSDHWPIRKIERHLHMGWDTIKKYLDMPAQTPAGRPRSSKLDPYKVGYLLHSGRPYILWSAPSALAKHFTIDLYGAGPTATACSARRRKSFPRLREFRRLKRKVKSSK